MKRTTEAPAVAPALPRVALLWVALLVPARPVLADVDRAALVMAGAQVLKIEVLRQQGGYALGSGVVIAPGVVVTNCHVTHDAVGIHVLRGDNRWRAEAQARDAEHDLCALRVPGVVGDGLPLGGTRAVQVGQSVTALGYTGGLGIQSSSGSIVGLHRYDGSQVIQTDNWFSSGASGGALLDDDLHLVGVLTFRLRGGAAHYYAAPADWLKPLLAGSVPYLPVAPADSAPLAYWQKPAEQQPWFLQAGALERDRRWAELEALSRRWAEADRDDAASLGYRSLALERLGRLADAQRALEDAVAMAPGDAALSLRLGRLYAQRGEREKAQQVRRRLERMVPNLARELELPRSGS